MTSEKLAVWKQSTRGAAKIRAALRDTSQTMTIRVEAAEALAEMGLAKVLAEDLPVLSEDDRPKIGTDLARGLLAKMKGSNPKATTRVQIQAKDALFAIRAQGDPKAGMGGAGKTILTPEMIKTVDEELVRWILANYQERDAGDHSAEKIIGATGQNGARVAAEMINTPGAQIVVIATFLRTNGDEASREEAGKRLVAMAEKQDPPLVQTFHALGKIQSLAAALYLEEIIKNTKKDINLRIWAMRALALSPHIKVLSTVKAIASDSTLTDEEAILRDDAFTVMENLKHPESLAALLVFLADKDDKVRYRAVEAIISGFKAGGLTKLLEGLPSGYNYTLEDLSDFVEKPIIMLGKDILPPIRQALKSESWIARLVAIRLLGQVGTRDDIAGLQQLNSDGTKIKGWPGGATLGSEAQAAVAALQGRK